MMMSMVVMCMVVAAVPHAEGAITCGDIIGKLEPCLNYALGQGALTSQCCNGVQSVYAAATTTPDRQAVCDCLKRVSSSSGGARVNTGNIQALPGKCGVNLPYKISPNMNCAAVR